jgi:hypothetical protein
MSKKRGYGQHGQFDTPEEAEAALNKGLEEELKKKRHGEGLVPSNALEALGEARRRLAPKSTTTESETPSGGESLG